MSGGRRKSRAFVERKTGASVRNDSNKSRNSIFLIFREMSGLFKGQYINMVVTQNYTTIASFDIRL